MTPLPDLSHLPAVFQGIKSGYHWSFGDAEYLELNERFEDYRAYFGRCGLELQRDPRGFIFSVPEEADYKGSDTVAKLVGFTAVWVDAWADEGRNVSKLIAGEGISLRDLPHLKADSHRRALERVGIRGPDDLTTVANTLERLGLAHLDSQQTLRLRPAFNRLLDVCSDAGAPEATPEPNPETEPADGQS